MGRQTALQITLLLVPLLGIECVQAASQCGTLFKSTETLEIAEALHRDRTQVVTIADEMVDLVLRREIVSPHRPAEGSAYIESIAPFKIRYVEKKFERKTVTSNQSYVAVYQRWIPHGPPPKARILLQHGFSRSHRYFHDVRLLLLSFGYEVVTMDAANVGSTLKETLNAHRRFLRSPSPLDDALAWADIIDHEKLHDLVLIGHSRGHAVMTLLLASGRHDRDLVLHFGLNPYVNWLVDQYLDGNLIAGASTRAGLNQASIRSMKLGIAKSFDGAALHENVDVPRYTQEQAVWQIGYGLMGEMSSKRGFSVLPLYDPQLSIEASDNGFGFKSPGVRLAHLSPRVLDRTRIMVSENDGIVTPSSVMPIVRLLPRGEAQLRTLRSTSPPADHYSPSVLPFHVAAYLDFEINRELAKSRPGPKR